MFDKGKLYQVKKYFWYLYPSKETAADAAAAVSATAYWSKEFNCNVTYISPNSIFCLLESNGKFLKVLTTNGEIGWMIYPKKQPWTKGCIEEVNQ